MPNGEQIIERLKLVPLTLRAALRETYRSELSIPGRRAARQLQWGPQTSRRPSIICSAGNILAAIHIVKSDEVFHFYAGDGRRDAAAVADGSARTVIITTTCRADHEPQLVYRPAFGKAADLSAAASGR